MLNRANLFPYQETAVEHILKHERAMIWLDLGLGKTPISLTAIRDLQDMGRIYAALVIAPLRVIQLVWRQEAAKWSHTKGMRFSLVHGAAGDRILALRRDADVYLINYEAVPWLAEHLRTAYVERGKPLPFDMVVFDEVSKMKNSTTNRSEAFNAPRGTFKGLWPFFRRHVGLTGEPASNGYKDLHGQYLAVDGGARLGKFITHYREQYLSSDTLGRSYSVSPIAKEIIHRRIRDITIEMSAEDYLQLPPVIENRIAVTLPPRAREIYTQMEKDFFMELDNGIEIEAPTEATRGLKCLQAAGGASYDDMGAWHRIHDAKLDALGDLLEEMGGKPLLLAYAFRHEAERIKKRFPEARFLHSGLPEVEVHQLVAQWDRGEIPLLCGHPASMGHGLTLSESCNHLVWFGLTWSLDLFKQFNGRIAGGHRRKKATVMNFIMAEDTFDHVVWMALQSKMTTQAGLKAAIKAYREGKR